MPTSISVYSKLRFEFISLCSVLDWLNLCVNWQIGREMCVYKTGNKTDINWLGICREPNECEYIAEDCLQVKGQGICLKHTMFMHSEVNKEVASGMNPLHESSSSSIKNLIKLCVLIRLSAETELL